MKKALLGIIALVIVVVIALVLVVSMQPAEFHVTRSTIVSAPPEEVFPHIDDFHQWQEWSPWADRDPNAKNSYEGPDSGEGAKFLWNGNDEVGAGSMTITESQPNESVKIKLEFIRPYEGTSDVQFTLKPEGEGTNVTWGFQSENGFMEKAMGLLMDMEGMLGKDFGEGLANLKAKVEESSEQASVQDDAPESPGEDDEESE